MKRVTLKVDGMHYESCAGRIRTWLRNEAGVGQAEASLAGGKARVRHDPHAVDVERLADVIENGGFRVAEQS